tara:strand:- start:4063 stop:4305 length:243 start_codon:yes stop_codon:yes gene_type:complete
LKILGKTAEWFRKQQENKQYHRDFTLRYFRQELEKYGYKDTIRAKKGAAGAPQSAGQAPVGGSGNAPTGRKDGDGDQSSS